MHIRVLYEQNMKTISAFLSVVLAGVATSQAATIQFNLGGLGGAGLRTTNETTAVTGSSATGGEILGGITFNDVTLVLSINTGWGTANGFVNLSGAATAGHLHGPTTSGGTASFSQTASVKYPLDSVAGWNSSASAGGFNGTVTILAADVAALMNGQFYMNVHTATNGGGEMRGNLIAVPEPTVSVMGAAALGLLTLRRRR